MKLRAENNKPCCLEPWDGLFCEKSFCRGAKLWPFGPTLLFRVLFTQRGICSQGLEFDVFCVSSMKHPWIGVTSTSQRDVKCRIPTGDLMNAAWHCAARLCGNTRQGSYSKDQFGSQAILTFTSTSWGSGKCLQVDEYKVTSVRKPSMLLFWPEGRN